MLSQIVIPIALATVGWTQSILLSLQTWESVRYARRRVGPDRRESLEEDDASFDESLSETDFGREKVVVMVPCKGNKDNLRDNLQPLFEQTYSNYELLLLAESSRDAANPLLEELLSRNRHLAPARIVYTGRGIASGQKVHNLLRATEELSDEVAIMAFVDSDACPNRDWLRRLVRGLEQPKTGAVTGYRWMVPQSDHPASLFLYSLNSALAGLLGPGGHYSVWGGSWAIRRSTFDGIGLRESWHGTLSDDLVATRALHGAGLKVRFSPYSVSRSEIEGGWAATLEFIRRQYLIARRYAPRLWRMGLANHVAAQAGIFGSLAWAALGSGTASRSFAAATSVALYGMAVLRGHWRQKLAACYAPDDGSKLRLARQTDIWLSPIFGLANLFLLLGSAFGSQIQWRGIRYLISPGGRILNIGRRIEQPEFEEPVILPFPDAVEAIEDEANKTQKRMTA